MNKRLCIKVVGSVATLELYPMVLQIKSAIGCSTKFVPLCDHQPTIYHSIPTVYVCMYVCMYLLQSRAGLPNNNYFNMTMGSSNFIYGFDPNGIYSQELHYFKS